MTGGSVFISATTPIVLTILCMITTFMIPITINGRIIITGMIFTTSTPDTPALSISLIHIIRIHTFMFKAETRVLRIPIDLTVV